MKNKNELPKIIRKKKINVMEFKKLAKKVKSYFEEEEKIKNENNISSGINFTA